MTHRFLPMLFIVAILGAGCASSVKTTMRVAPTDSIQKFKTIAIIVSSNVQESDEETAKFRRLLAGELANSQRWSVVQVNGEITLTATIIELTKVSRAARVLVGAMAGQASVETDVVLADATGTVLTRFHVKGKSSGGTVFAGTTEEALEEAAKEIAAVLQRL